jgi:hypothetical protein
MRRAKTAASVATNKRVRIEKQYQSALMQEAKAKAELERLRSETASAAAADLADAS